jgi:predicted RNA binding protein YcfA (HicA-like mRNA interferase family)
MGKRPSSKECLKLVRLEGFTQTVANRGGHMQFQHQDGRRTTVTLGYDEIPKKTFSLFLKEIKMDKKTFMEYRKKL